MTLETSLKKSLPLIVLSVAVGVALAWAASVALRAKAPAAASVKPVASAPPPSAQVTARGRLEPRDGVLRVAGPSRPAVVIQDLRVQEGDLVEAGAVIAVLYTAALEETEIQRLQAETENARRELERNSRLHKEGALSMSALDRMRLAFDVQRAQLAHARAAYELSVVRSPIHGRVLKVHTREGERVSENGIVEIGATDAMYAVAEVYETDIARVRVGQRAKIASPALSDALAGTVERIGMKIGKMDVLDTDPAARTDARVVEVEIRLDDSMPASALTYLTVDVAIDVAS